MDDLCEKWLENKQINPLTNRKISPQGKIYKDLEKKCKQKYVKNNLPTNEKTNVCEKWLENKQINPLTNRKISPHSVSFTCSQTLDNS